MDSQTIEVIRAWLDQHPDEAPWALGSAVVIVSLVVFLVARYFVARGLVYLARRTENKYDDIVVQRLRPFRFAAVAPLLILYYFAGLFPESAELLRHAILLVLLWLVVITLNSLLNAVNDIYETSDWYRGHSIQGYLDLVKIVLLAVTLILTASLFTGKSPVVLLSGLGAVTAILLLVFHDTLLSFVASLQIQSNDLVREGDWIEMPAYDADGSVTNISLHTVRVQNWDKTITVIPTYKLLDTPYKNWRGMEESGAWRIKRAIYVDVNSIKFCDEACIERFKKTDLVGNVVAQQRRDNGQKEGDGAAPTADSLNGRHITNLSMFRAYVTDYLKSRPDLHQEGLTLLVRQLESGPSGMPIELYVFAKTTDWIEYEAIQADVFDHVVAALPQFDLRLFQQPTGADFQALVAAPQTLRAGA